MKQKTGKEGFDFARVKRRHVLLKVSYFGWDYMGFASQVMILKLTFWIKEKMIKIRKPGGRRQVDRVGAVRGAAADQAGEEQGGVKLPQVCCWWWWL